MDVIRTVCADVSKIVICASGTFVDIAETYSTFGNAQWSVQSEERIRLGLSSVLGAYGHPFRDPLDLRHVLCRFLPIVSRSTSRCVSAPDVCRVVHSSGRARAAIPCVFYLGSAPAIDHLVPGCRRYADPFLRGVVSRKRSGKRSGKAVRGDPEG